MVEFKQDEDIVTIGEPGLTCGHKRFTGVVEVSNNDNDCKFKKSRIHG